MIAQQRKILVVEDEVLIADSIIHNLSKLGFAVVGTAYSYENALAMMAAHKPDLVLVDIRLEGEKTGIDLAHQIRAQNIPFIYLTSHIDKLTLTAAKHTQPAGYLTKPFSPESLYTTIEIALHNSNAMGQEEPVLFVRTGLAIEKIPLKEIVYLEAENVYVNIVTVKKKFLTRHTLKNIIMQLGDDFLQVHRSYVVNTRFLEAILANDLMAGGYTIPIGRKHKEKIEAIFDSKK